MAPVVGLILVVPLAEGTVTVTELLFNPSTSVSFPSTLITTGLSSLVEVRSLLAIGASLTGVTVMLTVATFEVAPPLSLTVYVIDAVPL